MRAHRIMTRKVISVRPDTPALDAANTMLQQHISGLPVVSETGKLVGIISEGDFIRRAEIGTERKRGRWLEILVGPGRAATDFVHERGRKVNEIMSPEPLTLTVDAAIEEIVKIMEENQVKRLPVLRGNQLVGIVTRANLLQAVADLARDVPDPTADDDLSAIVSSLRSRKTTGDQLRSASPCATASCNLAASSSTSDRGRRQLWQPRTFPASRRFTITFVGLTPSRARTFIPLKMTN